jgi:biotin carboxyl carrier protein/transcription antitermination factor NusG
MQNPVTQINPLVKIRRNRILPVAGMVLVRVGQKVTPGEILAETLIPTKHINIDVLNALGLKNTDEAEKLIDRQVGDLVEKHDIIAETGGLFSRVIRAPMPGKVISIKNGQVLLEVESRKVVVQSGYAGQVVEILIDRGAVVETNGTLIQGVWGNGLIGFGPFVVDSQSIDQELTPASLSINTRGTILAAAWCELEESLTLAGSLPIAGLVLGSMSPRLIPCALKQNYPILLLEGFGRVAINEQARKLLLASAQKEMSLNAIKWDHYSGIRPEISIALQASGAPEVESAAIAEGQKVRVHSSSYAGKTGVLTAINAGKTTLPNGLRTATASVLFQNNEKTVVPFSNFDIIEVEERFPA